MFSERNSIPCVATKVDPGSISNKGKYNESLSYLFGFEIEMLSKKNGGGWLQVISPLSLGFLHL